MILRRLGSPPWSTPALRGVFLAQALGLLLVVLGYVGARGKDSLQQQLVWLDVAIIGSVTAASAQGAWLLSGRRSVSMLQSRALAARAVPADPAAQATTRTSPNGGGIVTVAGSTLFHRPSCLLVRGKPLLPAADGEALTPCEICISVPS